jgi:hypothetical protein
VFDRVDVGFIVLHGNVGEFILDYTAPKNNIHLSYIINFDGQNIDTYRRGITVGLYRQY